MNTTPDLPYYAVIFTSRKNVDITGYHEMSDRMKRLSSEQEGFLGIQTVCGEDGLCVSISYWKTLDAIANWKSHMDHRQAQQQGKSSWYSGYEVRICKVERQYSFGEI